jgi:Protein of unknown function (DUF1501)
MDDFDLRLGGASIGNLRRRELLRMAGLAGVSVASAAVLGRAADAFAAPDAPKASPYKTKHVILLAFAGGVRAREVIGVNSAAPNLVKIGEKGCVMPNVKAANLGHYGAALAIFTGCPEAQGIRQNYRGESPTVFEYLRKDAGLPADQVWLSTTAGAQTINFSYSEHADYGAKYGANLISTDGLFNTEFRNLVSGFGNVSLPTEKEQKQVADLSKALDPKFLEGVKDRSFANDPEAAMRIQRYILEELKGDTADLTGPGAGDAKAIRVARNLLRLFKPKVIAIVLQNADVAHGSYNSYVEVIRRNDQEVGAMWQAVQQDPELKDSTSMFVLPEFGRDHNLNERNGLDHGDGSEDLQKVFCIAAGPDFKQGKTIQAGANSFDVCPTVAELLGAKTPEARGKSLKQLMA